MDVLNEKMIMTGSNVAMTWEVEVIRQRGRPKKDPVGGIVLRMTWKV